MASLSHRVTDDGSHEIVVAIDGVNVPLVSVAGYRVEQLRENAATRGDTAKGSRSKPDKDENENDDTGKGA